MSHPTALSSSLTSTSEAAELARADALLARESEEERELELAMQLLKETTPNNTTHIPNTPIKQPTTTTQPTLPTPNNMTTTTQQRNSPTPTTNMPQTAQPTTTATTTNLSSTPSFPTTATNYSQLILNESKQIEPNNVASSASVVPTSGDELNRLRAELKQTDRLISEMNKENQRLHMELKIIDAKYKNQLHQSQEELHTLRFELQAKKDEVTQLQMVQSSLAAEHPGGKSKINELQNQIHILQDQHHQEVANLKYELDKIRSVKTELAIRQDDAQMLNHDSLRLTLEALQEKYNALKQQKELEVKELHTKLVWYIENQELINTYQSDLVRAQKEITQLKDENLIMNHMIPHGTKIPDGSGKEFKLKPRPIDVKKIKELETKVAELTEIIKRKSATPTTSTSTGSAAPAVPGSLAGLISAIKPSMEEHELITDLRHRLSEVDEQLKRKDEESMSKLRSLRQETDQMKLLYEKRIQKLQKELVETQKKIPLTGRNKLNRISELERQIEQLRQFYGEKVKHQSRLIGRLRKGEQIDEKEMKEMIAEEEAEEEQAQQQPAQQTTQPQQESKESAHDSLLLPSTRPAAPPTPGRLNSTDTDLPRSPVRGQVKPHPHPLQGESTRDFLLFKQTLAESHEKDLHLITTRYETQFEQAKLQWESQIQLIRATHDADMKLQQSLLQQAQDEVQRIRQALTNEMQQRSSMQERCLQLESEVHAARNEPAYCNYKELEHKINSMTQAWQQREKEYADATAKTLSDYKQERALLDDKLRHKNDQLTTAQQRFQQLTQALKQMQEQIQVQKQTIMQQQQQQSHPHPSASPHSQTDLRGNYSTRRPLQPMQLNHSTSFYDPHIRPPASILFDSHEQARVDGFTSQVHEPEDLIDQTRTDPNLVNKENLELTWNFLMSQK